MNKEFVTYEQALALKELGFDEPCFGYYDLDGLQINTHHWYPENKNSSFPLPHTTNNPKISAPTFSQAFRWFREKHDIHCEFFVDDSKTFGFLISQFVGDERVDKPIQRKYLTYEEAEQACLNKLIK